MRSIISFVPVIKFNSFIQKIFLIKHLLIFLFSCSTCLYMLNITFGTLCFNFTQKQIKIKVFYKNTDCLIYHTLLTEDKIYTIWTRQFCLAYTNTPESKQVQRLPQGHSVVAQYFFTLILLSDVLGRVRLKFLYGQSENQIKGPVR